MEKSYFFQTRALILKCQNKLNFLNYRFLGNISCLNLPYSCNDLLKILEFRLLICLLFCWFFLVGRGGINYCINYLFLCNSTFYSHIFILRVAYEKVLLLCFTALFYFQPSICSHTHVYCLVFTCM